jgi:DNA invertase Pin-like site-specific DNA recombinase
MTDIAISYARFSNPEQAAGDSEDRQARDFAAFCQRHKLKPAAHAYVDRGKSGYKGRHLAKGDLGRLLELAKSGAFPPGTTLVIEGWDRLGRLRPDVMIRLISDLLRTGLRIGVARLDDIFSEADFGSHKFTTLSVFVQIAYQESKQKADRLRAEWRMRHRRAREHGTPATGRLPGWLRLVDGEIVPVPERAETIRYIFRLAGEGLGLTRIVKRLTDERVPPFGPSGRWTKPYVLSILRDRRVRGEWQPVSDGRPDGEVIPDYYTRVVEDALWFPAQVGCAGRQVKHDTTRLRKYVNVFAPLLKDARTGAGYSLVNKGEKGRPKMVLVSTAALDGSTPAHRFDYSVFEKAVLALLAEVRPEDVAPRQQPSELTTLEARLKSVKADIASLTDDLRRGYSSTLTGLVREKELERDHVEDDLRRLAAEQANPARQAWQEARDLSAALVDDDRLRLRLPRPRRRRSRRRAPGRRSTRQRPRRRNPKGVVRNDGPATARRPRAARAGHGPARARLLPPALLPRRGRGDPRRRRLRLRRPAPPRRPRSRRGRGGRQRRADQRRPRHHRQGRLPAPPRRLLPAL